MALFLRNHTHSVRVLDFLYLLVGFVDDIPLVVRDLHVVYADRNRCQCRVFVSHRLDVVKHQDRTGILMCSEALVDDLTELLLSADEVDLESVLVLASVNKAKILRDPLVVDETSDCGLNEMSLVIVLAVHSHLYLGVCSDYMILICDKHLVHACEQLAVSLFRDSLISVFPVLFGLSLIVELIRTVLDLCVFVVACSRVCQVVRTEDHVLCRRRDR